MRRPRLEASCRAFAKSRLFQPTIGFGRLALALARARLRDGRPKVRECAETRRSGRYVPKSGGPGRRPARQGPRGISINAARRILGATSRAARLARSVRKSAKKLARRGEFAKSHSARTDAKLRLWHPRNPERRSRWPGSAANRIRGKSERYQRCASEMYVSRRPRGSRGPWWPRMRNHALTSDRRGSGRNRDGPSRPSDSSACLALDASARSRGAHPKCTKLGEEEAIACGPTAVVMGGERPQDQAVRNDDRPVRIFDNSPWRPADRWGWSHGVLGKRPALLGSRIGTGYRTLP